MSSSTEATVQATSFRVTSPLSFKIVATTIPLVLETTLPASIDGYLSIATSTTKPYMSKDMKIPFPKTSELPTTILPSIETRTTIARRMIAYIVFGALKLSVAMIIETT